MLHFAVFFIMILAASKGNGYDGALVRTIEETLEECSTLVEAMGGYLGNRLDDTQRRDGNDVIEYVKGKFRTCDDIYEVVETLRTASAFLVRPAYGTIHVTFSESFFLRAQLSKIGKKIGDVLYIASRDGDQATAFHKACDNKGPTIAIFLTTTLNIFGGYTDQNWVGRGWRESRTSFVFGLRPKMKKYAIKDGNLKFAIYCNPNQGPYFADEIVIYSNAMANTESNTRGGVHYEMSNLNNGERYFQLKDYVVLQVKDL